MIKSRLIKFCDVNRNKKMLSGLTFLTDDSNSIKRLIEFLSMVDMKFKISEIKNRYSKSTILKANGHHFEFIEIEYLSYFRSKLNLPKFISILNLKITDNNNNDDCSSDVNLLLNNYSDLFSQRPILTHISCNIVSSNSNLNPRTTNLKEIVLSTKFASYFNKQSYFTRIHPNVFKCPDGIVYRLIPSFTNCLIFHVDDFETAINKAGKYQFNYEIIGKNGFNDGQLRLKDKFLHGFDIRLCKSNSTSLMFNEGQEALLENCIPELQNERVIDTDINIINKKFGNAGDCFSEFREVIKKRVNPLNNKIKILPNYKMIE